MAISSCPRTGALDIRSPLTPTLNEFLGRWTVPSDTTRSATVNGFLRSPVAALGQPAFASSMRTPAWTRAAAAKRCLDGEEKNQLLSRAAF
jgi:hypothetical protein